MQNKPQTYYSVLHKNCGGEIVLVASSPDNATLCCRQCKTTWETSTQYIPLPQVMSIGKDMYINKPKDTNAD